MAHIVKFFFGFDILRFPIAGWLASAYLITVITFLITGGVLTGIVGFVIAFLLPTAAAVVITSIMMAVGRI